MRSLSGPRLAMVSLASIGIADSVYLTADSFAKVAPYCPTYKILDCGKVTLSPYSHPFGIPVALLGLLWFVAMFVMGILRPSFAPFLMLPLWIAGAVMVLYLVYIELGVLGAICVYCTLAHVCTALMLFPVVRMTFAEE